MLQLNHTLTIILSYRLYQDYDTNKIFIGYRQLRVILIFVFLQQALASGRVIIRQECLSGFALNPTYGLSTRNTSAACFGLPSRQYDQQAP
jgi:hypothetical protein